MKWRKVEPFALDIVRHDFIPIRLYLIPCHVFLPVMYTRSLILSVYVVPNTAQLTPNLH